MLRVPAPAPGRHSLRDSRRAYWDAKVLTAGRGWAVGRWAGAAFAVAYACRGPARVRNVAQVFDVDLARARRVRRSWLAEPMRHLERNFCFVAAQAVVRPASADVSPLVQVGDRVGSEPPLPVVSHSHHCDIH